MSNPNAIDDIDITSTKSPKPLDLEWDLPPYSTPGCLLVEVIGADEMSGKWMYEVLGYDDNIAVFWINEGVGFDRWLDGHMDFPVPGIYLIEGISGEYVKGHWMTDDLEEWAYTSVRIATPEEIASFAKETA